MSLYSVTTSSATTTTTSSTSTTSTSTAIATPSGWSYVGCFEDSSSSRVLSSGPSSSTSLTIATCLSACSQQGLVYAGLEYGSECWCGDSIAASATVTSESDCSETCAGDCTLILWIVDLSKHLTYQSHQRMSFAGTVIASLSTSLTQALPEPLSRLRLLVPLPTRTSGVTRTHPLPESSRMDRIRYLPLLLTLAWKNARLKVYLTSGWSTGKSVGVAVVSL